MKKSLPLNSNYGKEFIIIFFFEVAELRFLKRMKGGVLEMKTKDNQSTIFKFFKPKASSGEENNRPSPAAFSVTHVPDSPKPTRIVEDLDPALANKSLELPTLHNVPAVPDALSVQDNMKLWTILAFMEDHAKGYLGSDMTVPDLGNRCCITAR